jgi:Fur family transcriptional regulator, ferric uptake regulator
MPDASMTIVEPLCAIFRRTLRAEGLKYTPERAHVLDAIVRLDGLFEAEGLLASLRTGNLRVSKATVYRTIRLLLESGIIQRVPIEGDHAHYRLAYGRSPTDLLIRLDTRRVEEIHAPELLALRDRLCRERGLEARGHSFQVYAVASRA